MDYIYSQDFFKGIKTSQYKNRTGKVISQYKSTIVIALEDDDWCVITNTKDLFWNAVFIAENVGSLHIAVGEEVYFEGDSIRIGTYCIQLEGNGWEHKLKDRYGLSFPRIITILSLLLKKEEAYPSVTALFAFLLNKDIESSDEFTYVAQHIKNYFVNEEDKELSPASTAILGLGQGLTPTGDDIIAGRLLVQRGDAASWYNELMTKQMPQISKIMFQAAYHGYSKDSIMTLIDFLHGVGEYNGEMLLENVEQVGHSSGIDTIVGVIYALLQHGGKDEVKIYFKER